MAEKVKQYRLPDDPITLDELKSFLWAAATHLRVQIDAAGYKEYIFPLHFFKRISDEALEQMRDHCEGIRDLDLIDLLASTGMRVGELVKLNRNDIDFENRECIVTGKGDKQRRVYFDASTKMHLQRYLAERIDDNPALFVSLLTPYDRLQISGVEIRLRRLGHELNIPKVHPHKFRRTLVTMAIDKGMPIGQVQHLLGHQSLDTTLQYAMVNQTNVKMSHRKFIG